MSFSLVSSDWVHARLDSPEFVVLDPRSAIRYLAGHPRNAISVPVAKARDADGNLPAAAALARWLGDCGVDDRRAPIVFDNADGRNAALLAWMLLYLGRSPVYLMRTFWEDWVASGREVFYRPVPAPPCDFAAAVRPELRCEREELWRQAQRGTPNRLLDVRGLDEFTGSDADPRSGHIPGAINLPWRELAGEDAALLASPERLEALWSGIGVRAGASVVVYCQTGLRAALAFLALLQTGRQAALYDGSFADWARSGLPVVPHAGPHAASAPPDEAANYMTMKGRVR